MMMTMTAVVVVVAAVAVVEGDSVVELAVPVGSMWRDSTRTLESLSGQSDGENDCRQRGYLNRMDFFLLITTSKSFRQSARSMWNHLLAMLVRRFNRGTLK